MSEIKQRPKPGEIWLTKHGYKVRVIAGPSRDIIETSYLHGRVDGYLGINFDADTLRAMRGDDELLGRA